MSAASLVFRIIYKSLYFFLNLVLVLLLLLIPADVIRQSIAHSQRYNILVITVCYILTILVVAFIYATRLYINRSALASIPKSWIPIERGDVNKAVRKMIVASLSRSAAIAYEARPRIASILPSESNAGSDDAGDAGHGHGSAGQRLRSVFDLRKAPSAEDETGVNLPQHRPVWGPIEHPGWASPTSPDLPNLQFSSVILELPHLIEAKALTLAPPNPTAATVVGTPVPDQEAVALLQRPESMGLRDYLAHLAGIGIVEGGPTVTDFITTYEFARFSTRPVSNSDFRELMHLFAELLRTMQPLDTALLYGPVGNDESEDGDPQSNDDDDDGDDIDDDAPRGTNSSSGSRASRSRRRSPGSSLYHRSASSSTASSYVRRRRPARPPRDSSANTGGRQQYRTAPTTPKSRRTAPSRSSSLNTFAQSRQPYPLGQNQSSSSASLRSDAGSVIRLADRDEPTDLPYVFMLPDGDSRWAAASG